jgi:hypothetical protein
MTKKQKRSVKRTPLYKPLNGIENTDSIEEKKDLEMETSSEDIRNEDVMETMNKDPNDDPEISSLVQEAEPTQEETFDSVAEEPALVPIPEPKPIETVPRYWNKVTPPSSKKSFQESGPMSLLSSPIVKYGLPIVGGIILMFLMFKRSPKSTGPIIVDVTDSSNGEKKSVRNSVNRVSSPRIVFGDLRKNPSLMVAPPITPAVN